jgi:glycosyltransferase involved in cell wall biosynthesis
MPADEAEAAGDEAGTAAEEIAVQAEPVDVGGHAASYGACAVPADDATPGTLHETLDVLHATPRLGRCGGGVWQFVHDLALAQADAGQKVAIVGLECPNLDEDAAGLRADGRVELHVASETKTPLPSLGYSPDLARRLDTLVPRAKLIHAHGGLRMWTLTAVRRAAKRHGKPTLFAPHGGLYPWLLRRNPLQKSLLYWMLDRPNLAAIDVLHATCPQELGFCRDYRIYQNAVVVPPGVKPADPGDGDGWRRKHAIASGVRLATFLGYFDRKKGLLRLLRAWATSAADDWHLIIAGHDQRGHRAELEAELDRLDLRRRVSILGPQVGPAKADLLSASELLILPSDWENFGVIVGEALAAGVPTITTVNTPWRWTADAGVGWHVEPTEAAVAGALQEATRESREQLRNRGLRGQIEVSKRCSWPESVRRLTDQTRNTLELS